MVELKLAEQKFGGEPWWKKNGQDPWPLGGRGTPSPSAKRSVEQKKAELKLAEQKFGGEPWPLGDRDP